MLTGLLEPDAGQAEVFGIDIFGNMEEMRKNLGVCPQHDVLFEFLTPEDHLRLFAAFKGTPAEIIEDQVQKMLGEIDLLPQKAQLSKTLSGGQKRKLSVAIAMIGNSKIVMLDEPTSGMDTSARRNLWEMLKKNKAGRIVILTTHYMDEADILGDRIAIMAEGDVQCTGSSLFLKNRYGVGYNLVIAKKSRDPAPQVDEFIQSRIQEAVKMQEVSREISYQLPSSSSGLFKNFFADFDASLDSLGVDSYGVGITTLEEVFLRIGHGEEEQEEDAQNLSPAKQAEKATENLSPLEQQLEEYSSDQGETSSFFDHTATIATKRLRMQIRDMKTLFIDTLFPVAVVIAGVGLATVAIFPQGVRVAMTPALFPAPLSTYSNLNSFTLQTAAIDEFVTRDYIGQNPSIFEKRDGAEITPVTYETEVDLGFMTNTGVSVTLDKAATEQGGPPQYVDKDGNSYDSSVVTALTVPYTTQNVFANLKQLDEYVFDQVENNGAGTQWASIYVDSIGIDA